MIKHYEGKLGVFDYDDGEFEIVDNSGDCLHYIGKGLNVNLPVGCKNTRYMFSGCKFPEGFTLGKDFDTSHVVDMESMFEYCVLPKGFSLGDKFNTRRVRNMRHMFSNTTMAEGFTLGNNFSTESAINMKGMFSYTNLPEGFNLGSKFILIENANNFFKGSNIYERYEGNYIKVTQQLILPTKEELEELDMCKKCFMVYLRKYRSVEVATVAMYRDKDFSEERINTVRKECEVHLRESCNNLLSDMLSISRGDGYSKLTIGQAKEQLLSKRYPKDIVNNCIIDYIKDQYMAV